MSKLTTMAARVKAAADELENATKLAAESADDNTNLFMAHMCARKAQLELDSVMRYLDAKRLVVRLK